MDKIVSPKEIIVVIICYTLLEHGQEQIHQALSIENGLHALWLLLIDILQVVHSQFDFLCQVQHLFLCHCVRVIAWSLFPLVQALLCS